MNQAPSQPPNRPPSRSSSDTPPDSGRTTIDVIPAFMAPVVRRRRSMLVADSAPVAPPAEMATTQQLDAFRELRTRLLTMAEASNLTSFTTLVVPVSGGCGASFVTRNLAAAFTLQEGRVAVLVDCNLRHPSQHLALGSRAEDGGLVDFLERPHQSLEKLARPTGIPRLHLIPAGRVPPVPREYFSSDLMRLVIEALRRESCFVFLDGPPAKGSPDARILSDLADFVILITSYGKDTSEDIAQAAALFDPNKFAGVVFNERPHAS
jgi:Mrp family chromosome partitioning ATPase